MQGAFCQIWMVGVGVTWRPTKRCQTLYFLLAPSVKILSCPLCIHCGILPAPLFLSTSSNTRSLIYPPANPWAMLFIKTLSIRLDNCVVTILLMYRLPSSVRQVSMEGPLESRQTEGLPKAIHQKWLRTTRLLSNQIIPWHQRLVNRKWLLEV